MKKAVCLIAALAFVAVASAEVQFFFTPSTGAWGLDPAGYPGIGIAADPFEPAAGGAGLGQDQYYGYILKNSGSNTAAPAVPADVPAGVTINPAVGQFAYLWVHFTTGEVLNDKITGIESLGFKCGGSYANVQLTTYAVNNGTGRWDGFTYPYADLRVNPQKLVAVTAPSIVYKNANDFPNLYVGGGAPSKPQYHTALLGAVRCINGCTGTIENLLTSVWTYPTGTRPFSFLNTVTCVPEPASLLLVGLAGLVLRRR
jgi:hypothetical protein